MSTNLVLPLFSLVITLVALYFTLALVRAGKNYAEVLERLRREQLKAAAEGNPTEAARLGYILQLLTMEEQRD